MRVHDQPYLSNGTVTLKKLLYAETEILNM